MSESNNEDQEDEILALSEILPQGSFKYEKLGPANHIGSFQCAPVLTEPVKVCNAGVPQFHVEHLPPILVQFKLPETYPSHTMPSFYISCFWLKTEEIKMVEERLREIWRENSGCVVLFLWIDFLQQDLFNGIQFNYELNVQDLASGKSINKVSKEKAKSVSNSKISDKGNMEPSTSDLIRSYECNPLKPIEQIQEKTASLTLTKDSKAHEVISTASQSQVDANAEPVIPSKKQTSERLCSNTFSKATEPSHVKKPITANAKAQVEQIEIDAVGKVAYWDNQKKRGAIIPTSFERVEAVPVGVTAIVDKAKYLVKEEQIRFDLVRCPKYGVVAQNVRRVDRNQDQTSNEGKGVGFVKKWHDDRQFGIIMDSTRKHEWKFHMKNISDENLRTNIQKGDKVTFSTEPCASPHFDGTAINIYRLSNESTDCDTTNRQVLPTNTASATPVSVGGAQGGAEVDTPSAEAITAGSVDLPPNEEESEIAEKEKPLPMIMKSLVTRLREYNLMKIEETFLASVFNCLVCFTEKQGASCVKFPDCSHVYCRECMGQYFRIKIESGEVSSLTCPDTGCSSQALPTQVKDLVSEELFVKYERILLDTTLESMVDIIMCPRVQCQCPTVIDRDNNMGQCPACQLTFCIYCKATYHGVSPCKFKTNEHRAIYERYDKGTAEEKAFLEKRYGRKELQTLFTNVLSEEYLKTNTKFCPKCNAPIEKNEGCNKITCRRCNTNFCWLCGDKLPAANPYSHFNTAGTGCYNALFEGVDPLEDDDDWEDLWDPDDAQILFF